jgi:hypothetical protein
MQYQDLKIHLEHKYMNRRTFCYELMACGEFKIRHNFSVVNFSNDTWRDTLILQYHLIHACADACSGRWGGASHADYVLVENGLTTASSLHMLIIL